jgi:hypothetical protein
MRLRLVTYALISGAALFLAQFGSRALAQRLATPQEPLEALTQDSNDPTAILFQLKVENDYTVDQYGTEAEQDDIILQPIIPIRPSWMVPVWQLVRPTFDVATIPTGSGGQTSVQFNDIQFLDLFESPWPNQELTGIRWGAGSYFVFPTATSKSAGSGAWQAGPAAALVYRGIPNLLLGGLLQQATSFAYAEADRKSVTQLTFEPYFTYVLGNGWYLRSRDATWKFNLRHDTSTEIPLSAGIGKVLKFQEGEAVNASIVGEWMVYRQFAPQVEQFTLKFQVTLLLPGLAL